MGTKAKRAAAMACALSLLLLGGCSQERANQTTVHPEMGTVENVVKDTGLVTYREPYSIIPEVNGKILACNFEEGDTVVQGQELYVIDSGDLEDQITQTRLSLNSASAAYNQALAACEDLTVTTPVSGAVTAVNIHIGDFVSTGTPVAYVVDSVNLTLTVPFDKSDAAGITPGAAATITFAAYGDAVAGTVKRVHSVALPMPGGREGVNVEISFTNPGVLSSGAVAMASVGGVSCMDNGVVEYAVDQAIYATQSGQVHTLPVQVGDIVTAGQALLTIDNASLTGAAENARLAQESAAVSLAQMEAKLADYVILAPVDGVVTARNFKLGDYAVAATPMAVVAEDQSLCINVPIDEIYIERIWQGQAAQVTFTSDTGETRTYDATVRKVGDTGITSGGVTNYTVELDLEQTDGLKSGMNVDVAIITERKENCLYLPADAVSGGKVQVLRNGKTEEVSVETGITGGGYIEILGGVSETDEVVLP